MICPTVTRRKRLRPPEIENSTVMPQAINQGGEKIKIPVAISHCLLGATVRYDGSHKLDREILETLGDIFEWEPICPEVETGLGVPRERMILRKSEKLIEAIGEKSGKDYTNILKNHAISKLQELSHVRGFILKSRSPSCGLKNVRITCENGDTLNDGTGIFTEILMRIPTMPPVESSERLHNPKVKQQFVTKAINFDKMMNNAEKLCNNS